MIHPITNLNEVRKNLNIYYKGDAPFIYRTGGFACHTVVSIITFPTNFGLGTFYLTVGVLKSCAIRVYNIAIFKLRYPQFESKRDSTWWYGQALDSYVDFTRNCIEHVIDVGDSIGYGYRAICWVNKKIDLKVQAKDLQKLSLCFLKAMENYVDRVVNLFYCRSS